MLHEIIVPELAESTVEATVATWIKKDNEVVSKGDVIIELDTDKVSLEIVSPADGQIKKILKQEGEIVKVGSPIAIIDSDSQIQSNENKDFVGELENKFEEIKDFTYKNSEPEMVKLKNDSNKFYSPLVLNIANRENISLDVLCGFAYEWPTILPSVSTEGDPAPTIPSPSESVNPASITSRQPSPSESRSR